LRDHQDQARAKIQTSQLINRLEGHALDLLDPQTQLPVKMSTSQIKAAEILLRKTIPDLQSIEGSMDLHHHKHEQALGELE
jgi:hypothetical protein